MSTIGKNTQGNKIQGVIKPTPILTNEYKFYIPAAQPVSSGSAIDLSANNNIATIDAGTTDSAVWATPGFMTTTGAAPGVGKGLTVQKVLNNSPLQWNMQNGQSLLLAFKLNIPTLPTGSATRQIIGDLSLVGGLSIVVGEASLAGGAGRLSVRVRDTSTNNTYTPNSSAPQLVANTTHSVVVWVNGTSKQLTVYVDGVVSGMQNSQSLSSITGSTVSNAGFNFGYYGDLAATSGTTGVKVSNIHALVFNTVPNNISSLLSHLILNVSRPIEYGMIL